MTSTPENNMFCSGDLTVYPQSGRVEIQGEVIRLGLVNMHVLVALLENAGEVVSRANIHDRVWKNQTVSDDTLTRCVSELRTQLGRYSSQSELIETLPKRGYRWIADVSREPAGKEAVSSSPGETIYSAWKRSAVVVLSGLVLLLLFTMSVLWLIDKTFRPELVRVALVPVYASQPDQKLIAADLDDILQQQLLATDNLRFFAGSAQRNGANPSFPYPTRELSAQWVIEGDIRQKQDRIRISLSLVDAKTALVVYSMTRDLDNDSAQLEEISSVFVDEISRILLPGFIE